MNDRDLEKILKEYFTRISAPESTTKYRFTIDMSH